jgi:chromosome segregation ATPase
MSWRMNVRKNRVQDPNSVQLRQQIEKKNQNRQQVAQQVDSSVNVNRVLEWHETRLINIKTECENLLKKMDETTEMLSENNKINTRNEQMINACTNNLNLVEKQIHDKMTKMEVRHKDLETFVNEMDQKNKKLITENLELKDLVKTIQTQFELFRDETNVKLFNDKNEADTGGEDISRSVVKTVKKLKTALAFVKTELEELRNNKIKLEIKEQ